MEPIAKHFREITKPAFKRYGFAEADIVAHWAAIIGEDLAAISAPERISWPRASAEQAQRQGGTLVIRAAAGRALDLQYEASRIIGRINAFFGYGAVSRLKVTQTQTAANGPAPRPVPAEKPLCEQEIAALSDDALRAALERLGKAIAGAVASSPQGK